MKLFKRMSQAFPHNQNNIEILVKILKDSNNRVLEDKSRVYGYDFKRDQPRNKRTILVKEISTSENERKEKMNVGPFSVNFDVVYSHEDLNQFKKRAAEVLEKKRQARNFFVEKPFSKFIR